MSRHQQKNKKFIFRYMISSESSQADKSRKITELFFQQIPTGGNLLKPLFFVTDGGTK
jgi:hypothetical protein